MAGEWALTISMARCVVVKGSSGSSRLPYRTQGTTFIKLSCTCLLVKFFPIASPSMLKRHSTSSDVLARGHSGGPSVQDQVTKMMLQLC